MKPIEFIALPALLLATFWTVARYLEAPRRAVTPHEPCMSGARLFPLVEERSPEPHRLAVERGPTPSPCEANGAPSRVVVERESPGTRSTSSPSAAAARRVERRAGATLNGARRVIVIVAEEISTAGKPNSASSTPPPSPAPISGPTFVVHD